MVIAFWLYKVIRCSAARFPTLYAGHSQFSAFQACCCCFCSYLCSPIGVESCGVRVLPHNAAAAGRAVLHVRLQHRWGEHTACILPYFEVH